MRKVIWIIMILLTITLVLLWRTKVAIQVVKVESVTSVQDVVSDGVKIIFLDIGQGDASLIKFPNGEKMLVDCAVDSRILAALGRTMPFYDRTIDYLVITHPDLDHYGGCVDVLKRFQVKNIIYNGLQKPNDNFWQAFWQAIQAEGANNLLLNKETSISVGSSTLDFIFPDQPIEQIKQNLKSTDKGDNNTSIIFTLNYQDQQAIFMGDAPLEVEKYLLDNYSGKISANILKVGHHGSSGSSMVSFLQEVKPQYAIISVGKGNRYNHPSLRVVKRLERVGAEILRTDEAGDIVCELGSRSQCQSAMDK